MTLQEWRQNSERLSLANDMLNQPTLQEMLIVMEAEHPAKQQHAITDGFGATRVLGVIEGFQLALTMFRAFGQPLPTAQEAIPVTWGIPDPDEPKP